MKKFLKSISFSLAFLLVVSTFSGCSLSTKKEEKENSSVNYDGAYEIDPNNIKVSGEFIIGATGPLTGDAAVYGNAVKNGAQMAIDEINAAGGFYGAKFKLAMLDDQLDPSKADVLYDRLLKEGMDVSLGSVTTNVCEKFATKANNKLFIMNPSASSDKLPQNHKLYQMCYSDSNYGYATAKYVNEKFTNATIGLLYDENDAYYNSIAQTFIETLDDSIKVIDLSVNKNTYIFSNAAEYFQSCQAVFMPLDYELTQTFIQNSHYQLLNCTTFIGLDNFEVLDFEAINNGEYTITQDILQITDFDPNATEGPAKEFKDKFLQKYADTNTLRFSALAYDSVYAIFNAMKKSFEREDFFTPKSSPEKICEILTKTFAKNFKYIGVTGAYKDFKQTTVTWSSKGYVQKEPVAIKINY